MKALKISLLLGVALVAGVCFNDSIAQTFSNSESENDYSSISARQQLVVDLLRQEIRENKALTGDAANIDYELKFASSQDQIATDCYRYTPLLVNIIDRGKSFISYYNLQGNFGYTFENKDKTSINFNFYQRFNENGNFDKQVPSVTFRKGNNSKEIEGREAVNYITNNYCQPLNQILDQNSNQPIPQLLQILKQHFSK